jgi:hypothetical protein
VIRGRQSHHFIRGGHPEKIGPRTKIADLYETDWIDTSRVYPIIKENPTDKDRENMAAAEARRQRRRLRRARCHATESQ